MPHIFVGFRVLPVLIPGGERVVRRDLVIEPRTDVGAGARRRDSCIKGRLIQAWVQHNRANDGLVVDISALGIEEERCFFAKGPADTGAVLGRVISGLLIHERVHRIECRRVPADKKLAVIVVGSGLGEDFDPTIPELVEFRRKRILVDANLAYRSFGRKLAGGEAIDVHLSAIGTSGRTSQGVQVLLQLIRIIGQGVEVLAGKHNSAGVACRIHIDRSVLIGDCDILLLDFFLDANIEALSLTRADIHGFVQELGEALRVHLYGVFAGRKIKEFVASIVFRFSTHRLAVGGRQDDGCVRHRRPGRIGDLTAERARTCLSKPRNSYEGQNADGKRHYDRKPEWGNGVLAHCEASSPPPDPRDQGDSRIGSPPLGAAARMGSTPPSSVIAVTGPAPTPSVDTTMIASPF